MSLPLSSTEGYLFSRLDGMLTVDELCATVGLELDEVSRIVNKLVELNVVDVIEMSAADDDEPTVKGQLLEEIIGNTGAAVPAADIPDELSLEVRQLLNTMRIRVQNANYYEMLGIPPTSSRGSIRKAYFDLSKKLHPDSYFGKNLGKYRLIMEDVFGKVTEAYETLSRKDRRVKYDEYIADQIRAWDMERRLRGEVTPPPEPVDESKEGEAETQQQPAPPRRPTPPPPARIGRESDLHRRIRQERGRSALMKLINMTPTGDMAGKARATAKAVASSIVIPEPPAGASTEATLAYRYAKSGVEALELNDLDSAMNFLQLATQLVPQDRNIRTAEEAVRTKAQGTLSRTYERQGRYEEEAGHYLQAAASFSKALDIKSDDHQLMHRVALNLLRGDGNYDTAKDLARQAVKGEPKDVGYRVTLAEIYLKKGWESDATRELDAARELDPNNARVVRLLRAVGSGS